MPPERRRRAPLLLAVLAIWSGAASCARDPKMVAWEDDWRAVERQLRAEDYQAALDGFRRLERDAVKPLDAEHMRMRQAAALLGLGRRAEGLSIFADVAVRGLRRQDRARAHYEIARAAEALGVTDQAIALYRALTCRYPDLMPGVRGLSHLERLTDTEQHLAWTHQVYPRLKRTELGDNLVYFAANEAYERFKRGGDPELAAIAERLYLQIHRDHYVSGMWDDALWALSYLYHRQARYPDEIIAIRRIQSVRERASRLLIGNYEHTFYWVGQLRIARLQLLELDEPAAAATSYSWFLSNYPLSRWRDDALFWQGCAYLRAERPDAAERSFALIEEAYDESKYLRRLDAARAEPYGSVCEPVAFEEGEW